MKFNFSEMTVKQICKSIFGTLGTSLAVAVAVIGLVFGLLSITKKNYCYEIFKSKVELSYYSTKDDLIKCIDQYIDTIAHESAMNGFAFLEQCDKYNVDVRFAIVQAQVESQFATQGIAAKTHSAFNVMAYDGRTAESMIKAGHCYDHPDRSIEPYLMLLTTEYMCGGKTEMDLLNKFVNKSGKRYATSENYEQMLRSAWENLTKTTNISSLYDEYQKYKMICGM